MDYTTLSLADVRTGLDEVMRDAQATFGGLTSRQLNWRPDATRWSVAQCFEHLVLANELMFRSAEDALNGTARPALWQRVPGLAGALGRMLIRSQAPTTTRRFTAAPKAQPAASDISPDVLARFIAQHRRFAARLESLDERQAARTIMTSPFMGVIVYSVLDGWRLVLAHDRRHFDQAHRVTRSPDFPSS